MRGPANLVKQSRICYDWLVGCFLSLPSPFFPLFFLPPSFHTSLLFSCPFSFAIIGWVPASFPLPLIFLISFFHPSYIINFSLPCFHIYPLHILSSSSCPLSSYTSPVTYMSRKKEKKIMYCIFSYFIFPYLRHNVFNVLHFSPDFDGRLLSSKQL